MNHLNKIKTSPAFAICWPLSWRARQSYSVSDISNSVSAEASGQHQSRLLHSVALSGRKICQPNLTSLNIGAGKRERFKLRPNSINLHDAPQPRQLSCSNHSNNTHHRSRAIDRNDQVRDQIKGLKMMTTASMMNTSGAARNQANPLGSSSLRDELDAEADHQSRPKSIMSSSSNSLSAVAAANELASANKNFSKLVGKKASRFKELVLQNLGKADRTQDEFFDLHEHNFHRQQQQASKLTKEFKSYAAALKHFHEASRSLNKCIQLASGDYQPARHDLVCENLSQLEALNEDLLEKLQEQVLKQVGEYVAKFDEMKVKISKRHRKLIDYDKSRRLYVLMLDQANKRRAKQNQTAALGAGQEEAESYHSIVRGLKFLSQQPASTIGSQQEFIASQLVDEARLLKFREQFNYSKLMYESINGELHDELPIVYEKKMKSLLVALQNYFALEAHYHSNAGKLMGTVGEIIDELPNCAGVRQAMAARKLSAGQQQADHHKDQTMIVGERADAVEVGDDDDEDDDDSYESGSSSGSSAGLPRPEATDCAKARQLATNVAGGSSSGLGSSQGDSSCSVGSSSPDYPQREPSMVPAHNEHAEEEEEEAADEAKSVSGKAEEPVADCSTGAAVAEPAAVASQPEVGPIGESDEIGGATCRDDGDVEDDDDDGDDDDDDGDEGEDEEEDEEEKESSGAVLSVCNEKPLKEAAETSSQDGAATLNMAADSLEVLYKVRTSYKYLAEDVDELCFEPDEIIQVIALEENQEPEEGWLMGVREINGQRGLFPANFTQPI